MDRAFSTRILTWFERHGRKNLPWQRDSDPYGIWVSEIMLQQTRVDTVIPYYRRFIRRFADVRQLACASSDEVLHYWTGLGYYARARNLHKAAVQICERHSGVFPQTFDEVVALPGIGRSTAGAILALACDQSHAVLDGNVKRVLARYFAVEGWPGERAVEDQLWRYAESLLPEDNFAQYTQAMMDLGATLCTRTRPDCAACPLRSGCLACKQQRQLEFPTPKPSRRLPQRKILVALVQNCEDAVWLEKRPPVGVWGGLYSFPEFTAASAMRKWLTRTYGESRFKMTTLPPVVHTFSHFRLHMSPRLIKLSRSPHVVMEDTCGVWYKDGESKIGLAAPIKKILQLIAQRKEENAHDAHRTMREAW